MSTLVFIGTGVKVAHSMGEGNTDRAMTYIKNGFVMSALLGILYMLFIFITKDKLIGFFVLANAEVELMAKQFLVISMIGLIFSFINTLFSTILNSLGNSRKPFQIFTIGFLVNIILDPLLIFGFGSIRGLGVVGAAIATVTANLLVTSLFLVYTRSLHLFPKGVAFQTTQMKEVIKMGIPITVQRVTFIIISILIAKIIVQWGAGAIAVQKVGIQIESISYMTIGGLQGAIAAFLVRITWQGNQYSASF